MAGPEGILGADVFERTVRRVTRVILIVAFMGATLALAWRGWIFGLSFAVGAAASWLNFRWLAGFVGSLGPDPKRRASPLFAIRYIVFALAGYAILRYSKLNPPAALAGLFVSLAAVLIEVFIQLTYERRNLGN